MEWHRLSLCLHGPPQLAARAAPPNQRQSKRGVRAAPCTPSALKLTDSEKVWPSRSCVFLFPPCLGGKPPYCDLPAWPACLLACCLLSVKSRRHRDFKPPPPSVQLWVRFFGHKKAIYHDPMPMLMLTRPSIARRGPSSSPALANARRTSETLRPTPAPP
jgi:hypothetical protein